LGNLNAKFSHWARNRRLINWVYKNEPIINLLMAIGLGVSLIFCGLTRTLLVPNFIICSHCPQWLPAVEIIVGGCVMIGLFGRLSGLALLGLMYMAVCKHGLTECLDILPLLGLALYFILNGRNKFSLDYLLNFDKGSSLTVAKLGHYCVRATMGLGLIVLALSEKLLHPQLAMDLLQHAHALNPFLGFGMSNAMFVLLAGLVELSLGVIIFLGYFPRVAVIILLGIFVGTTAVFGVEEFIGHAACYSSILSIVCWGAAVPIPSLASRVLIYVSSKLNLFSPAFVP
jgi:hypothetical protein